jgi:hypothetical protein
LGRNRSMGRHRKSRSGGCAVLPRTAGGLAEGMREVVEVG